METIATEAGVVSGLVESITTSMHQIDDIYGAPIEEGDTFVDYQTRMVTAAKEIARLAQEMVCFLLQFGKLSNTSLRSFCWEKGKSANTIGILIFPGILLNLGEFYKYFSQFIQVGKSVTDASQLGSLGASLSHQFSALASDSAGAIRQSTNVEVANRLRSRSDIFYLEKCLFIWTFVSVLVTYLSCWFP